MSTDTAVAPPSGPATPPVDWNRARALVHSAGRAAAPPVRHLAPADADGCTLAAGLAPVTDLPAFPTSSVDGWAVRGPAPWRVVGRVLAGAPAPALTTDGTTVEIATGAMVPAGTAAILRIEESTRTADGLVTGVPRPAPEWRLPGEEARAGEELVPAGTPVDPGVIGLAASCGLDTLAVRRPPRAALLVFGDELLTAGPPGAGRVRDALGPSVPGWLRRYGCRGGPGRRRRPGRRHPSRARRGAARRRSTRRTWSAPPAARCTARSTTCTRRWPNSAPSTSSTPWRSGPASRCSWPGSPAPTEPSASWPDCPATRSRLSSPSSRWSHRCWPECRAERLPHLPQVDPRRGRTRPRATYTHLALVRLDGTDGRAHPVPHVGSSMLRGLATADGFAVIPPGDAGEPGDRGVPRAVAPAARGAAAMNAPGTGGVALVAVGVEALDLAAHEAAVADRAGRRGGLLPGRGARPRPRSRACCGWSTRGIPAPNRCSGRSPRSSRPTAGGLRRRHLAPGRSAGDRRRGAGRGGQHRAPGGGLRRLRPAGRRGQGAAADLEAAVLRRRHRGVGELPLIRAAAGWLSGGRGGRRQSTVHRRTRAPRRAATAAS